MDRMNVSSTTDLMGVSLPEELSKSDIKSLVAHDHTSFFTLLGEKILAEASEIEWIENCFGITLQSSAPQIRLNTSTNEIIVL